MDLLSVDPLMLGVALMLLGGVLLSKTSSRFGVPSLLLFLFLGMLAGDEGLIGIAFDDFELSQQIGVVALAFILFAGGLGTSWDEIKPVLPLGVALASAGVVATAVVVGVLASAILDLDLGEGMLLGSIIASTDAAAVFSILRSRGVAIPGQLRSLLELESGSNDPSAVFLTIGLITFLQNDAGGWSLLGLLVMQLAVGLVMGVVSARAVVVLINRLRLEYDGLYPVLTIAFVMLTFQVTTLLRGSGFLAVYVAGLVMANADYIHKGSTSRFHDAIAWLMQIAMFTILGLLVFPSRLLDVAGQALLVAALLIFVARPIAVVLTALPFRLPTRETVFTSWVGLRGAAPVILATFPVVAGVPNAETIFHVVFFVVLTSVLVQGTTIPYAARVLGLATEPPADRSYAFDAVRIGDAEHRLRELHVPAASPVVGKAIVNLGLPAGVLVILINREDRFVVPQGRTEIAGGDELLVLAEGDSYERTRDLLEGRGGNDEPLASG